MLQLGKTGYTVGREIVLRDPWYGWQVLDGSKPILSELQNLCALMLLRSAFPGLVLARARSAIKRWNESHPSDLALKHRIKEEVKLDFSLNFQCPCAMQVQYMSVRSLWMKGRKLYLKRIEKMNGPVPREGGARWSP